MQCNGGKIPIRRRQFGRKRGSALSLSQRNMTEKMAVL